MKFDSKYGLITSEAKDPPPATWWGACSECGAELANQPVEPHAPECSYWDTFDFAGEIVQILQLMGMGGAHERMARERLGRLPLRPAKRGGEAKRTLAKRSNERSVSSS